MKKFILANLFFLAFSLICLAQEKIYMPYFEVINIHADYQLSSSRLLKTYMEIDNKAELVLPAKDSAYYSENKEQALAKAKSLGISLVLLGEMNRTGETVIISMSLYKTENGEKVWSSLQKAAGPDDLDPVMQKIAQSIKERKVNGNAEDIYNVSDYNAKQLNKMEANTYWGLEIGGCASFLGSDTYFPAGFGIVYSGDMRSLIFDIKGSLYFSDVNIYNLKINVNYPLLKKTSSPYIGGGLGYGGTELNKKDNYQSNYSKGNGLSIYANAGYIFNRTSNINLRLNSSLYFSMYKVNSSYPAGLLVGVSVLF
jgi:hypothetical protein